MKKLFLLLIVCCFALPFAVSATLAQQGTPTPDEIIPIAPATPPFTPNIDGFPLENTGKGEKNFSQDPFEMQIIGGALAAAGEFPWQVGLVFAGAPNALDGQFCGGSILAARWVVTAAHCVTGGYAGFWTNPADIQIVAGITKLSTAPTNGATGQRIAVQDVFVHPSYNPNTIQNDIALLYLASPLTFNTNVQAISLIPAGSTLDDAGQNGTVSGWGATSGAGSGVDDLRKVVLPIISNATCNTVYSGDVTSGMLCTGYNDGSKGSCYGDSGGPYMVTNGVTKYLAGIVSWGAPGCTSYSVFTRVESYLSWVNAYVFPPAPVSYSNNVYLPIVMKNYTSFTCVPTSLGADAPNTIATAAQICPAPSLQINATIDSISDADDVFKVWLPANAIVTIYTTSSASSPNDLDLYLYAPGATGFASTLAAQSNSASNFEYISGKVGIAGLYYIDVYAYAGTIPYSLYITVTP